MCTAISHGHFAGRNLDVESGYGEKIIITPRRCPLSFKKAEALDEHYAIIGMGVVSRGYPLYFDAANERGLYIAGLSYLKNAKYMPADDSKINIAPYELIPYLLSRCASTSEAESELRKINLVDIPFSSDMPIAELHFFITDSSRSITVEPDADGLKVYKNPVGVLTNNPPFPIQLFRLNDYMNLSSAPAKNRFSALLPLESYSFGMGAIGLPGDLSSSSRFVRAAFHKLNSASSENLADIMHLLTTVSMPKGSVKLERGLEYTEYTSAVDLLRLVYSYRVYESPNTYAVKLSPENTNASALVTYGLKREKEPPLCDGSDNGSI